MYKAIVVSMVILVNRDIYCTGQNSSRINAYLWGFQSTLHAIQAIHQDGMSLFNSFTKL